MAEITSQMFSRELGTRIVTALYMSGITTTEQIKITSDAELMRIPNFGRKCLTEIRRVCSPHSEQEKEKIERNINKSIEPIVASYVATTWQPDRFKVSIAISLRRIADALEQLAQRGKI